MTNAFARPLGPTLAAALLASTCLAGTAQADIFLQGPPPIRTSPDQNGVDLVSGAFTHTDTELSIGPNDKGGLSYTRSFVGSGWRDNLTGTITANGSTYTVSIGGVSEAFTKSGTTFTSVQKRGSTLSYDGTRYYTYIRSDGTTAIFDQQKAGSEPYDSSDGRIISMAAPSGEKLSFSYDEACILASCDSPPGSVFRLRSVVNNQGYQIHIDYADHPDHVGVGNTVTWARPLKITAFNMAVDYCNPDSNTCPAFSQAWPSATHAYTPSTGTLASEAVTDTLTRTTTYTYDTSGRLTGITRPTNTGNVTIGYDFNNGTVNDINGDPGHWTYTFAFPSGGGMLHVTDPGLHNRNATIDATNAVLNSYTNEEGEITKFDYYPIDFKLKSIEYPEHNITEFTYDSRGNTTQTKFIPKTNPADAVIVTADYDASCSAPAKCNKPNAVSKPRLATDLTAVNTDYTYSTTHGGVLTVTLPDPDGGGGGTLPRPKTTYTYGAKNAWYKNSSGAIVQDPNAIQKVTKVSTCQTGSSCSGTTTETKTDIAYGTGSSSSPNNLLPTDYTSGSGDGVLTAVTSFTYTSDGDVLTRVGPLRGATDTTTYRYDDMRQLQGVLSPDPDGAGAAPRRAVRLSRNADGQVTKTEQGTVTGTTNTAWNNFIPLQVQETTYDGAGRPIKSALSMGATTFAVTQYSYDADKRLDCTAVRMNPATFGSLPSSACTVETSGTNGPSRVSQNAYDKADRLTGLTTALGTADAATEAMTYTNNGRVFTTTDGKGNKTTFEYDGFDRLKKTRYPNPNTTGSSTTDYEQLTYDPASNVTNVRRRGTQDIGFEYDNLNRLTRREMPGAPNDVDYLYDNLGRLTKTTKDGKVIDIVYDALSRKVSETTELEDVAYLYYANGQTQQMTWPDGFYVAYTYDNVGELKEVRENGATSGIGVLARYDYDDLGRRTLLTRGDGVTTAYGYGAGPWLLSQDINASGTNRDLDLDFTRNPAGQILTRAASNTVYSYAAFANVSRTDTINGLNQITANGAVTLTYDDNANLTFDRTTTFTYDAIGRLDTALSGGVQTAGLKYDGLDRLYSLNTSGTRRFLYDGADIIAEYGSGGALQRRFVHGPGVDEPLVWYEGTGTTARNWLIADERGSIVGVANDAGTVTSVNTYDEYGVPASANTGRFGYTGQAWIPEAGVYSYKARVYQPGLGRFNQPDPIGYGSGLNLYGYVGGDPVNFTDPWGLQEAPTEVSPVIVVAPPPDGGIYTDVSFLTLKINKDLLGGVEGGGGIGQFQQTASLGGTRCVQSSENASKLDYDRSIYSNGETARQHIIRRHLSGAGGVSQYSTTGGFFAVRQTNFLTYLFGHQSVDRGSIVFDLISPLWIIYGGEVGTNAIGGPAGINRLVVLPDCQTVVTSYPR